MFLADALSRAYPKNYCQLEICHAMEELENTYLPISSTRLKQIQEVTSTDHSLQVLMEKVLTGWPGHKSLVPPEAKPYIKCHDELTV